MTYRATIIGTVMKPDSETIYIEIKEKFWNFSMAKELHSLRALSK